VTQRCRGDEGQSSVELALALPVVALVALCVVQAAVVALRHVLVVHAAREAVRAAAVDDTDPAGAAEAGARRASTLDDARLEVRTVVRNDVVEVIVIYRDPTDVVLAGTLVPDVGLRASAVMRREQRVLG
jgi:hypothetical protein